MSKRNRETEKKRKKCTNCNGMMNKINSDSKYEVKYVCEKCGFEQIIWK